jgi:magnesium transporter
MIVNSYQINNELKLLPCNPDEAADLSRRDDARVWIDLCDFDAGELEAWLDRLEVRDLSRRLCLEARDRPGFYPFNHEMFLVIPVLADVEVAREYEHAAFLCRGNLLLTLHRKPLLDPRDVSTLQESDSWLSAHSIAGLVSAVMIDLSLTCLRQGPELRRLVTVVEERMDRDPESVEAEEILDIRSQHLMLSAAINDQLPCMRALSVTDKPFFKLVDAKEYINCALANLQAADGLLDRLNKRIEDLRAGFQMHAQDKTNRRLNMLTILSAIFMPVTLLASIWGMNFEVMPELSLPNAYPLALGFMALVGTAMYLYFRRQRWFD